MEYMNVTDLIFDFCGVLIDWQPRLALEGEYPPGVVDMFFDPSDQWGFEYYDAMLDAGWSEARVLADYERHHGPAVAWVFHTYLERQDLALHGLNPGMAEQLEDLHRAGIRLWGLTNFTTDCVSRAREKFPQLNLLRGVVVSAEEQLCKPDPNIYRLAIDRFEIDPRTTGFVDDQPRNVEVAATVGLRGVRFCGAEQFRAKLGGL